MVSTCPGVACRKIKHRTCYTCSSPERVKQRAEQERAKILVERESGTQLYIFIPGALGAVTAPYWFQEEIPQWPVGNKPILFMKGSTSWDAGVTFNSGAMAAAVEKINTTPTKPFIMHPQMVKDLEDDPELSSEQDKLVAGWVSYKISIEASMGKIFNQMAGYDAAAAKAGKAGPKK